MKTSSRAFAVVALVGLSVFVLSLAPAQAQYRRPVGAPVVPYRPVAPRAFVTTPPPIIPYARSYTYLPNGLNLNQATALNALRIQTRLYGSLYGPYYGAPYAVNPYLTPGVPYYTPGIPYNPYLP
jgi:hypothetical protein